MAYLQTDGLMPFYTGIVLTVVFLYLQYRKKRNLPPGPVGWPILGCYPYFRKDPLKAVREMGRKYGSVFGLYIGPRYVVVLNDWNALTEAFGQPSSLYRPSGAFSQVPYNLGFNGRSGSAWSQSRRLSMKVIKEIGLHHTRWEELVEEETSDIIQRIIKHGDGPQDVTSLFSGAFCNNIMALVLGNRLPAGHHLLKYIADSVDAITENSRVLDMINYSPKLRKMLEFFGLEEKFNILEELVAFSNMISNTVDEKIRTPENESEDSFIDRFYSEVKSLDAPNRTLLEGDLKGNVVALLTGGTETSRTSAIWTLIAMADHPEKQKKVHEELDRVLGRDGSINWADRMKVPYTFATILESMRWRTVAPITGVKMAHDDMKVQGYLIPKGSYMTAHLWMIHNDTRYWKEPEKFIPERFLLEDGTKVNTSPESFYPFSYGKRNCPGKLVAEMEILVFFSKLMQKFKVMPADGKKVKYDISFGITYQAANVKLRFIPRDNE